MVRLIEEARKIAIEAGEIIISLRDSALTSVMTKADSSPVTAADLASSEHIVKRLDGLKVAPVISEEGDERETASGSFWLVDPLDGTKDFVAGKRSFVVNIALVENRRPVLGVIYAPMLNEIFWAEQGQGAYKVSMPGAKRRVTNESTRSDFRVVASGSQMTPRLQAFIDSMPVRSLERFGSALKMCRVAEGSADVYPRFGQTSEWDTAAGQIILNEAGCKLLDLETGHELEYGKPGLLNNGFIASRKDIDLWPIMKRMRDEIRGKDAKR